MIDAKQIPDEVVKAMKLAAAEYVEHGKDFTEEGLFRAALTAALNAWAGMEIGRDMATLTPEDIILPLPKEGRLPEDEWGPPVGRETL